MDEDYDMDGFDESPAQKKQPVKPVASTKLKSATNKIQDPSQRIADSANKMKSLVNEKPIKPATQAEPAKPETPKKQTPRQVQSWQEISSKNDTNKHIIFKFLKKGFTSLSAEELACTLVQPDFTNDFLHNTGENWVQTYQFKVVERLNKCKFNMKWQTKASVSTTGEGDVTTWLELCKTGDIERVVRFLRQSSEKTSEILDYVDANQSKSGLHFATEQGQTQMVEFLLNKGAKVDGRDRLLRTPLHLACLGGHPVIAKLLLEFNADAFERDTSGRTSMHYACCTGSVIAAIELMAVLTQRGQDLVHMKDHTGRTPLHYSVFNQQPDATRIMNRLIDYGANLNALDVDSRTPLHFAAEAGKGKICTLLIQNGASVGIQDSKHKSPMDLAANDYVREIMIVSNPASKFKPSNEDLKALQIDGNKKEIRLVSGLHQTDFYEPYEHAQPKKASKSKPKINEKPQIQEETPQQPPSDMSGVQHFHRCTARDPTQEPSPEMLCQNCRPLGPAGEWEAQKGAVLPYNIRNYQAKLIENLRRVQKFGVESFEHVKKPYMFTGSWMEYVRDLDGLMLQINGCRSNEAVMKVFNILFPYDKPLPRGQGDELILSNFYNDKNTEEPDVAECHPDKLRENIEAETKNAVADAVKENRVDDINDLFKLQQQMTALQTANHMALLQIESKDVRISELLEELNELKNKKGPAYLDSEVVALEERNFQQRQQIEKLTKQNTDLTLENESLQRELNVAQKPADDSELQRYKEECSKLNKFVAEIQDQLAKEKERNTQLRMKAGRVFMQALEDPLLGGASGKVKTAMYCPEDDDSLMRLLKKLDQLGGAGLEQKLYDAGNKNTKMISQVQFDRMLEQIGTEQRDYLPLQRIAGYTEMQGTAKNIKVTTIMARVNERPAMRKRIEEETMQHIAKYINKRPGTTIDSLFDRFEVDKDGAIDIDELTQMFKELEINVNNQLLRILLAIFDHNGDQRVSREEFTLLLEKYVRKEPIKVEDVKSNVIDEKNAQELVAMHNEEIRVKRCYEDYDFDYNDVNVIRRREAEAIDLIKSGQMPSETMKGEVSVRVFNAKNLVQVPGKQNLLLKLKCVSYNDEGKKEKAALAKIVKNYDAASGMIETKIPVTKQINGLDKHRQADTMQLELYMTQDTSVTGQGHSFIGECFVPYKQCMNEEKLNQWDDCQMFLVDLQGRGFTAVTGQVNINVRFIEVGHEHSSFNADGTIKEKKPAASSFVNMRDPAADEKRKVRKGEAGVLTCNPKILTPKELDPNQQYVFQFTFGDQRVSNATSAGVLKPNNTIEYRSVTNLEVNDTSVDHNLTAMVMVDDPVQMRVLGTGLVPSEVLQALYDGTKQKPFDIALSADNGANIGSLTLHLKYKPLGGEEPAAQQEQTRVDEEQPAKEQQQPEEAKEQPAQSEPIAINMDSIPEDKGGFDDFE